MFEGVRRPDQVELAGAEGQPDTVVDDHRVMHRLTGAARDVDRHDVDTLACEKSSLMTRSTSELEHPYPRSQERIQRLELDGSNGTLPVGQIDRYASQSFHFCRHAWNEITAHSG